MSAVLTPTQMSAAPKIASFSVNPIVKNMTLNATEWDEWYNNIIKFSNDDRFILISPRKMLYRPTGQIVTAA